MLPLETILWENLKFDTIFGVMIQSDNIDVLYYLLDRKWLAIDTMPFYVLYLAFRSNHLPLFDLLIRHDGVRQTHSTEKILDDLFGSKYLESSNIYRYPNLDIPMLSYLRTLFPKGQFPEPYVSKIIECFSKDLDVLNYLETLEEFKYKVSE
jgi:hypothetical protein